MLLERFYTLMVARTLADGDQKGLKSRQKEQTLCGISVMFGSLNDLKTYSKRIFTEICTVNWLT